MRCWNARRSVPVITKGFQDALRIGYQNRPDIFARQIVLPEMLYERVIEVENATPLRGRINPGNLNILRVALQATYDDIAPVRLFMHGYRYPEHEQQIATIARNIGFTQVSVYHEVSP